MLPVHVLHFRAKHVDERNDRLPAGIDCEVGRVKHLDQRCFPRRL